MKRFALSSLAAAAATATLAMASLPALAVTEVVDVPPEYRGSSTTIPGRYIVVFKDHVANPAAEARAMMRGRGGEIHHVYSHALRGFAATIPDAAYNAISRNPNVAYIEQSITMYPGTTVQNNATWGLDRIDQRLLPRDSKYGYNHTGAGVRAYVIDSGIHFSHADFGGRAANGRDFIGDGRNGGDCNGHGTHVAGTIGGTSYGVAKGVSLVSVRIFGCSGGTSLETVIAAVDWVTANGVKPAVVNMSLGGGYVQSLNTAVANSIAQGFVYAVSAGNDGRDACNYSPASTPEALTVGATQSNDDRASYSNLGNCVDLFAPGSSITSAWHTGNSATNTISGTSMAAPHVAGVAALVLQQKSTASPAEVAAVITGGATKGIVNRSRTTNNDLLYSLVTIDGGGSGGDTGGGDTGGGDTGGGDTGGGGDSGSSPLSGSATKNGGNWIATVTFSGAAGTSTNGSWSTGTAGGCTIPTGGSSCSFSISLANRVGSVTYTDNSLGSVTITKP
jgi:aqualysin 1